PPAGLRLPSLVAPMPRVKACENAGPDRTAGCGLARDPSSIPGREGVRTRVFAGSRHGLCAETRPRGISDAGPEWFQFGPAFGQRNGLINAWRRPRDTPAP